MEKITFVNNKAPYLSAENLNKIQDNMENAIDDINVKFNGVKLFSCSDKTSVQINSVNGYGIVLVTSAMFTCVVQLQGNSVTIHDIQGNHGEMTATMSNNIVILSNLYNWDHYILIGSDAIQSIQ